MGRKAENWMLENAITHKKGSIMYGSEEELGKKQGSGFQKL